jgi:hypothetical protein
MMRRVWRTALMFVLPTLAFAAEQEMSVELNGGEFINNRCQLTFVVENKGKAAVESLRLDLFVFNRENRVYRRMVTEMGPVRAEKTVVKLYALDGPCTDIRSILVNDITACAPIKPDACLDNLALSSRMEGVRFFK